MPRAHAYLVSLVVLLSAPAPAAAAAPHTNAPPGNSAIDEYLETVPGASGDTRPRPPRAHGGATLTPTQRAQLRAQGPEGETLARVVDATSPADSAAARTPAPASERATPGAASGGRSPIAATVAAATGSDDGSSLGPLLSAILIVSLIVALAAFGRSRRHDRT